MSTILATTSDRQVVAATKTELDQAQQVVDELTASHVDKQLSIDFEPTGEYILVPKELSAVVARVLRVVAAGGTVTIGSMPEELTTTTAAEQLGVSRPTLMKMIARGEIPAHKVGSHTRLSTPNVLSFRAARLERQRQAFDEMRALEDDEY